MFNAGGNGGGDTVVGGCIIYYDAKREGDEWTVDYIGSLDP